MKRGDFGDFGVLNSDNVQIVVQSWGYFVIKTSVLAKIRNCKTLSFLVFRPVLNKILRP